MSARQHKEMLGVNAPLRIQAATTAKRHKRQAAAHEPCQPQRPGKTTSTLG